MWIKVSDAERESYIANKTDIDYIYLDGKHYYNPANFKLTAHVKNLVDDSKRDITSKNNLMANLSKIPNANKFIMPQYELDLYILHTVCTGIESSAQCNATGVTHNSRFPFSLDGKAIQQKENKKGLKIQ